MNALYGTGVYNPAIYTTCSYHTYILNTYAYVHYTIHHCRPPPDPSTGLRHARQRQLQVAHRRDSADLPD